MKLIHLTDTHFVPQHQTLYGRDPSVALKRCLADINSNHADADLCGTCFGTCLERCFQRHSLLIGDLLCSNQHPKRIFGACIEQCFKRHALLIGYFLCPKQHPKWMFSAP